MPNTAGLTDGAKAWLNNGCKGDLSLADYQSIGAQSEKDASFKSDVINYMGSKGANAYVAGIDSWHNDPGSSDTMKAADTSPVYASLLGPNADPKVKSDLKAVLNNTDPTKINSNDWNNLVNDFKGKDPSLAKSATDLLNSTYNGQSGFPMNGKGVGDLLNTDIQNNASPGSHWAQNQPSAFARNGGQAIPTVPQDYKASDGSTKHLSDSDWQAINQWMVSGCKDKQADGSPSLTLNQYKEVCDAQNNSPNMANYLAHTPGGESLATSAGKASSSDPTASSNAAVQNYVAQYFPAVNDPNNTQAQTVLHVIQNQTQDNKGGINDHDFADCLNQLNILAQQKGGTGAGSNYANVLGMFNDTPNGNKPSLKGRLDTDVKFIQGPQSPSKNPNWAAMRDAHHSGTDIPPTSTTFNY